MQQVRAQAQASPDLFNFLLWYCEEQYADHVYSEGYGEERALQDGYAKQTEKFYKLLKGLLNE